MKKSIISFVAFCCILLISRHVVNDLKQEERISILENEVDVLYHMQLEISKDSASTFVESTKSKDESKHFVHKTSKSRDYANAQVSIFHTEKKEPKDTLKFSNPILLDLNKVDSATLVRVPGIAAKTAATIIRYRDQLGGFVSPRQLEEKLTWDAAIAKMDEWCTKWFIADPSLIRKLNVNQADFKQILRHPYISYEQTKALVNYRNKYKKIEGFEALEMMDEFTEEDIKKLKPYLIF